MTRSPVTVLVLLLVGVATLVATPAPSAWAGSYVVEACGSSANHSWVHEQTSPTMQSGDSCPADGSDWGGLYSRDILASPDDMTDGQYGRWSFYAPDTLSITAITYKRWLFAKDDQDLRPELSTAAGAQLEGCSVSSPTFRCDVGTAGGEWQTFTGLNTSRLSAGVRCQADPGVACGTGGTIHHFGAVVYDAHVTISDTGDPAVGANAGSLVAGGWVHGTRTAGASASDASGIAEERVYEGATQLADGSLSCDFTYAKPCADLVSAPAITVDTTQLADGVHHVDIAAVDPAGNTTRSASTAVQVDNHAPTAPTGLHIAQSTPTRASALDVSWDTPPGQFAPITTAHWSLCPQTGGACQTGSTSATAAQLPAPEGAQRLAVWLQDAAGNSDPATAATADVVVDRSAPTGPVNLHAAVPGDTVLPRNVTVSWADPPGQITPIAAAHWQICQQAGPCSSGSTSDRQFTFSATAPGSYAARVWLEDQAGNADEATASTTSFTVTTTTTGTPPGGRSPAPPPTTPAAPDARQIAPKLRIAPVTTGRRLTVTATVSRQATGSIQLRVTVARGDKRLLSQTRTVLLAGGRARLTLRLPKRFTRVRITARYSGDSRFAASTARASLTRQQR